MANDTHTTGKAPLPLHTRTAESRAAINDFLLVYLDVIRKITAKYRALPRHLQTDQSRASLLYWSHGESTIKYLLNLNLRGTAVNEQEETGAPDIVPSRDSSRSD